MDPGLLVAPGEELSWEVGGGGRLLMASPMLRASIMVPSSYL
jgi:hypothetical protein